MSDASEATKALAAELGQRALAFAHEMQRLGAHVCLVSIGIEDDEFYAGSATGFGQGPAMMSALGNLLESAQKHDAVAVYGAVQPYIDTPELTPDEMAKQYVIAADAGVLKKSDYDA